MDSGVITAELRYIYSTDIDVDTYRSPTPDDDGQWIRLIVGPKDALGEESLDVLVCTSHWLAREIRDNGPRLVRHTLLMPEFDIHTAEAILRREVEKATGETWEDVAQSLVQTGYWEFDSYRP
nr:Imm8 family immunity protein [Microbacterium sp. MAH-37]